MTSWRLSAGVLGGDLAVGGEVEAAVGLVRDGADGLFDDVAPCGGRDRGATRLPALRPRDLCLHVLNAEAYAVRVEGCGDGREAVGGEEQAAVVELCQVVEGAEGLGQ